MRRCWSGGMPGKSAARKELLSAFFHTHTRKAHTDCGRRPDISEPVRPRASSACAGPCGPCREEPRRHSKGQSDAIEATTGGTADCPVRAPEVRTWSGSAREREPGARRAAPEGRELTCPYRDTPGLAAPPRAAAERRGRWQRASDARWRARAADACACDPPRRLSSNLALRQLRATRHADRQPWAARVGMPTTHARSRPRRRAEPDDRGAERACVRGDSEVRGLLTHPPCPESWPSRCRWCRWTPPPG